MVDLATLELSLSGGVPASQSFGPKELQLHSVHVWATTAPAGAGTCDQLALASRVATATAGLSYGFSAKGTIAGIDVNNIAGAYLADGQYCLGASLGAANLPGKDGGVLQPVGAGAPAGCAAPDAPALQNLTALYSSATGTAKLDGTFCLPGSLRKSLGKLGDGTGTISLRVTRSDSGASLDGDVRYALAQPYWLIGGSADGSAPLAGKAAVAFQSLGLHLTVAPNDLTISLGADGKLRLPQPHDTQQFGAQGAPPVAAIHLDATAALGANPRFEISARLDRDGAFDGEQPCTRQRAAITDLFGQQGLDVCSLAVTGSLSASPSIAARASFILPATWGRELGVANASYGLGFSVSATSPCLDLAVSQRNPSAPAIDLFNKGVLTADQVHLVLAPTGCRLPAKLPGQPTEEIPAGFQISFDGSLLRTPVNLFAAMTLSGSSFKIDANLRVGRFALGPVTFDADTVLDVLADPGSSTYRFALKTSATIGTAAFKIDASFSAANNTIELHARNIELNFDLLLASFKGKMSFDFVQTPQRTQASFNGHLDVDLRILTVGVDVNGLVYDSAAGGLQSLNVAARTSFNIGPASGSIDGSVMYEKAKSQIGLALGGSVSLWGFKTAFNLPATLSTNISLPFSFGSDADTTRISPPGSIIVLRLKGFTTGHLDQRGAVDIDKPVPNPGVLPVRDRLHHDLRRPRRPCHGRRDLPRVRPRHHARRVPIHHPKSRRRQLRAGGRVHGQRSVRQVPRCAPGSLPGRHEAMDVRLQQHERTEVQAARRRKPARRRREARPVVRDRQGPRRHDWALRPRQGVPQVVPRRARPHPRQSERRAPVPRHPGPQQRRRDVRRACDLHQRPEPALGARRLPAPAWSRLPGRPARQPQRELVAARGVQRHQQPGIRALPQRRAESTGLCVAAASKTEGAKLRLERCTGSELQRWGVLTGYLGIGPLNASGFDSRTALCVLRGAKQGDHYPLALGSCSRAYGHEWDVTD